MARETRRQRRAARAAAGDGAPSRRGRQLPPRPSQQPAQQPAFRRVVVPTEQVIETKDGQKVQAEKRVLPGYVLVNMAMSDESWTVVKGTPGVTGFVGAGAKPVPLSQPEVDRILHAGAPA